MAGSRHEYRTWGKLAEDDITRLPKEYEARVSEDNRVYFVKYVKIYPESGVQL